MKYPRVWSRPKIASTDQPRDDGRGKLLDTAQEINLGAGIPHGIRRDTYDITHGYITGQLVSAFPPYDSEVYLLHLQTPHGIVPTHVVGKNIDDNTPIASLYVGNPQV